MKTFLPKKAQTEKKWFLLDAAKAPLGKIAVEAARHLAGKHRSDYTPAQDLGDSVIVINAAQFKLTGNKMTQKKYRSHSGYRGHLKEVTAQKLGECDPAKAIRLAVAGMLPNNRLKRARLTRLRIFSATEHSHTAQQPELIEF